MHAIAPVVQVRCLSAGNRNNAAVSSILTTFVGNVENRRQGAAADGYAEFTAAFTTVSIPDFHDVVAGKQVAEGSITRQRDVLCLIGGAQQVNLIGSRTT